MSKDKGMSIGSEIMKRRKALGMTLEELALQIGSDSGNVSRIERDLQGLKRSQMEKIATVLGCSIIDLMTGSDQMGTSGKVPLISWVAAGRWTEAITGSTAEPEEWLACPVSHSDRTFALRVKGESMFNPMSRPSFADGDIIFVDPKRNPVNKSLVVVMLEDSHEATFKRLLVEGMPRKKMLEALNPSWPNRIFEVNENARFVGVVIARAETFV